MTDNYDFMLRLGEDCGFHWRDETFFKRDDEGCVVVTYIENFNNHPQVKRWRIPPNEWASIVCSVSAAGETAERWVAAQDFHGHKAAPVSPVAQSELSEYGRLTFKDALEQIAAVATDNRSDSCDHRMAINFIASIIDRLTASQSPEHRGPQSK